MSTEQDYDHDVNDYGREAFSYRSRTKDTKESRKAFGRKRSKSPQSVNGLHKRRRRKITW